MIQHIINRGLTDRWCRGPQRPWDSAGRHVYSLNKPEQLHGPLSPHRKDGTQNGMARHEKSAWRLIAEAESIGDGSIDLISI